jgi:hypothetical protein
MPTFDDRGRIPNPGGPGDMSPIESRRRQLTLTGIKAAVSTGLIYWILRGTDLGEISAAVAATDPLILLLAFSLHFVGYYVSVLRWRLLLKAQNVSVGVGYLLKSYIVAMFFNNLLPSTGGGDAVRAYDSWRAGRSRAEGVAVVFIDRFLGLFMLMLFAFISPLFITVISEHHEILYPWIVLGFTAMLFVVWIIFFPSPSFERWVEQRHFPFSGRIARMLRKLVAAFATFQGKKRILAGALGYSAILQTNIVVYYYLLSEALGFEIAFLNFFFIVPLSIFVMMLPVSINGIGLRENTFFFFLALFGVAKTSAIAFAWVEYGIILIQGILGGIVYAFYRK